VQVRTNSSHGETANLGLAYLVGCDGLDVRNLIHVVWTYERSSRNQAHGVGGAVTGGSNSSVVGGIDGAGSGGANASVSHKEIAKRKTYDEHQNRDRPREMLDAEAKVSMTEYAWMCAALLSLSCCVVRLLSQRRENDLPFDVFKKHYCTPDMKKQEKRAEALWCSARALLEWLRASEVLCCCTIEIERMAVVTRPPVFVAGSDRCRHSK